MNKSLQQPNGYTLRIHHAKLSKHFIVSHIMHALTLIVYFHHVYYSHCYNGLVMHFIVVFSCL